MGQPPCFSLMDAVPEFVVWSERPAGTLLRLPCFFTGELPTLGLNGLWLQAGGYHSRASWVGIEVTAVGSVDLYRG